MTVPTVWFGPFSSISSLGAPNSFGTLASYAAGTSTPQATYQDANLTVLNQNPITLNALGQAFVFLTAGQAYKFVCFDSLGNQLWSEDNVIGVSITSASLTGLVNDASLAPTSQIYAIDQSYNRTAAEIAAGVTPVNYGYPPGYVDRYGTNTAPGITDMSGAFSNAVVVASKLGCSVTWGATAPYRLNNPVNCTGIRGVVFRDQSSGNASAPTPSILIGHTGHGFDCSASTELSFYDMAAANVGGTVPKTLFFCARNAAGSGAGIHRFQNVRTSSASTFSWIYYGYGSEENTFLNCELYNSQNGSGIASHNQTNPSGYSSSFITIATGAQSNADHRWLGGNSLVQTGNSGSQNEICIGLENAANFTFRDGLFGNAHGLAYVEVYGSSSTQNFTFDSIRGEPVGTHPVYGFYVAPSSGGVIHLGWTFNNVTSDGSSYFLNFLNTNAPAIQNLAMRACTATSGYLLNAYSMSNSVIETLTGNVVTGQASGTVANNAFIGWKVNITLNGTATNNVYLDTYTGNLQGVSLYASGSIGLNGNSPPSQVSGWGSPTGAGVVTNYSGAAATLVQTSNAVAEIIVALKNLGLFAA